MEPPSPEMDGGATAVSLPEIKPLPSSTPGEPSERAQTATTLPEIDDLTPEELENRHYVLESQDQIDDFTKSIDGKRINPSQRLRSLDVTATKSWTCPMPQKQADTA